MRLINADLLKAKAYPGYHTPGEVDPLVVELSDIDDAPTIFAIPAPVKCGKCALHDHCKTEEIFIFSRFPENKRFCGVSWRKDDNHA